MAALFETHWLPSGQGDCFEDRTVTLVHEIEVALQVSLRGLVGESHHCVEQVSLILIVHVLHC